jgi:hypothetical protein
MRGVLCLGTFCAAATLAYAADVVDVPATVARSVATEKADWDAHRDFSFTQTEREDGGPTKTYEVTTLFGTRYRRLIAVNGRPLSAAEQAVEERKFREESDRRKKENPADKARRIEKARKDRDEELTMLLQMAKAFDFRSAGIQTVAGHPVWVLDATPKPGYEPPNQRAKVLLGMRGKMWIAQDGYHWVKVKVEVFKPVYFEGFLARVGPGTRIELEKAPVVDGTWLPKHFALTVDAKILGLFSHNRQEEDSFSNYHRAVAGQGPSVAAR